DQVGDLLHAHPRDELGAERAAEVDLTAAAFADRLTAGDLGLYLRRCGHDFVTPACGEQPRELLASALKARPLGIGGRFQALVVVLEVHAEEGERRRTSSADGSCQETERQNEEEEPEQRGPGK